MGSSQFDDGEEFEDLKEMEAFVDQQIALLQMQSAMAETDYRNTSTNYSYCARSKDSPSRVPWLDYSRYFALSHISMPG